MILSKAHINPEDDLFFTLTRFLKILPMVAHMQDPYFEFHSSMVHARRLLWTLPTIALRILVLILLHWKIVN